MYAEVAQARGPHHARARLARRHARVRQAGPFDIQELRYPMAKDELELGTLSDRKSALFAILSDTDSSFNFVAALMYSQLSNLLCDKADDFYGERLPVHVRCLIPPYGELAHFLVNEPVPLLCDPEFHLDVPFPICHAAPTPFP